MRTIFLFIFSFIVMDGYCQHSSMLANSPWWSFYYTEQFAAETQTTPSSVEYWTTGTEELNGKTYQRLAGWRYGSNARQTEQRRVSLDEAAYLLGIREENGQVLVDYDQYCQYLRHVNTRQGSTRPMPAGDPDYIPYRLTAENELVLYDFTMRVGDAFAAVGGHDAISVIGIDKVTTLDGVERQRFTLSNGLIVIEGIGCINSRGGLLDYLNPCAVEGATAEQQEPVGALGFYRQKDSASDIYEATWADVVAGLEAVGVTAPRSSSSAASSMPLFDLQGHRISGLPQRGVYIQGGRKYVAK